MTFFRLEVALITCILGVGVYIGITGRAGAEIQSRELSEQQQLTQWLDRDEKIVEKQYEHLRERAAELSGGVMPEVAGKRVSDAFPDVMLTNHYGQKLRFKSDLVRDRTTCFAMFYTRCQGTCPGTISKMLKIRESLTTQFGRDNIHFVCITLDAENDSPEILMEYAKSVGALNDKSLADIHFCTGAKDDVEQVRRALGMYDLDPVVDADPTQHAAMIVTGADRFNRWASSPSGLPVQELHETTLRIAGSSERQRFGLRLALDSGFTPAALEGVKDSPAGYENAPASAKDGCCDKAGSGECCSQSKAASCCSGKSKGTCCEKAASASAPKSQTNEASLRSDSEKVVGSEP